MRTPLVLLAIAAAALGPAATAAAKEIATVKVCGVGGCQDRTDQATMAVTDGGPPTAWPDERSPFYRVKISVKGEDGETVPGWTFLWVPAAQKVKFEDGTWGNPPSTTIDELTALTRKIEPLPASKLVLPTPAEPTEVIAPADDKPAPARDSADGLRLPTFVWVLLVTGALGLAALLARGAASVLGRRGGSAPAG
jgi:hypothetical protein